MKTCTKCFKLHELTTSWCRDCKLNYQKEHYQKNKTVISERQQKYKELNKEKILSQKKSYRDSNELQIKEYRKSWREKHKSTIAEKKKIYRQEYMKIPQNKLSNSFRGQIKRALSKNYTSGKWKDLLGCSIEECRKYLEDKFQPGMTWENYGLFGWHIDHKEPISSFNMNIEEEQKKAFHFSNLQPLWAIDNLKKGSR